MSRRRVSSGGPWEAVAGYSRAIAVGDALLRVRDDRRRAGRRVAPPRRRGEPRPGSFAIVEGALGEAGFTLDEVVRTRMYVVDPADIEAVTLVHGEIFKHVRPAATMVVVARLMTPSLLIEVEAEARKG